MQVRFTCIQFEEHQGTTEPITEPVYDWQVGCDDCHVKLVGDDADQWRIVWGQPSGWRPPRTFSVLKQ
ncbi:MAG: hypothetical protein KatS3mg063_2662 [Tepidiforma sp.]|nr:MAG: hypothetical protein KatS3mg063_2662 [Tepidiforma sp.]